MFLRIISKSVCSEVFFINDLINVKSIRHTKFCCAGFCHVNRNKHFVWKNHTYTEEFILHQIIVIKGLYIQNTWAVLVFEEVLGFGFWHCINFHIWYVISNVIHNGKILFWSRNLLPIFESRAFLISALLSHMSIKGLRALRLVTSYSPALRSKSFWVNS